MFRRNPPTITSPAGGSPVQVQTTELATLYQPRISLIKDVLVPQTHEQAEAFAVVICSCLRVNSISVSPAQIDWPPGSTYGTVAGAWSARLVPSKAGLDVFLNDQPVTEVATTWYDWMDHAQEAAETNEDGDEAQVDVVAGDSARIPVLVRLNGKGTVEEERPARRGRPPKGFIRAFKTSDGKIVDGDGQAMSRPQIP